MIRQRNQTVGRKYIYLSFIQMHSTAEQRKGEMSQNNFFSSIFLVCLYQYLHVQFGAVPDQVPFAKHWRVGEPLSEYPSMHEYTMEWEKVVPSTREIRP